MLTLTGGHRNDITQAEPLLASVVRTADDTEAIRAVLADKGYDSDSFVEQIEALGAEAVIPSRKNRTVAREHDVELYKDRNPPPSAAVVERFFGRIKHYRRVATRYEKTARNYLAMLHLVSAMVWLL